MTRWQVSCEARAWRRWGHLIAVCAGTDPIEASTYIGINSLDAQKCDCKGMAANSQLKRHGCGVSGSTSRVSSGEHKSHGSWHVRHKGVGSGGTEVWPLHARTIVNHVDAQNYGGRGMDPNLINGGTGVYSLQPQGSRQVSCEERVLKHRRRGNEAS